MEPDTTLPNPLTILDVIKTDLFNAWGAAEASLEGEASILWDDFKVILTGMMPAQYAILRNFVIEVLPSVISGNVAEIEAAVLNLAAVQEIGWIKTLGSRVLQAIIAIIIAAQPAPAPVANTAS